MYNWSVDEKAFKKRDPEGYRLWRITPLDRKKMEDFFLDLARSMKKEIFV